MLLSLLLILIIGVLAKIVNKDNLGSPLCFNSNYKVRPHRFATKPLQSDMSIFEIVGQINTLLPQFANFIDQFSTTVNESGINVVTDSVGNMSIDVPQSMSDEAANKIGTRIGIIDRLITTRGQEIEELLQKGTSLEHKLKMDNPNYVSQLTTKIEEFKKLNSSYKH